MPFVATIGAGVFIFLVFIFINITLYICKGHRPPKSLPSTLLIYFHVAYFHKSPKSRQINVNVDADHYSRINMAYVTISHLNTTKFYKNRSLTYSVAAFALRESLITSIHAYDLLFTSYATCPRPP